MVAVLHDEICPISEQLLFSLYDAAKRGLPVPVSDVPKERRSSVALFCYRQGHLEQAGLAVAATWTRKISLKSEDLLVARYSSGLHTCSQE
jgi:hypothetical protein